MLKERTKNKGPAAPTSTFVETKSTNIDQAATRLCEGMDCECEQCIECEGGNEPFWIEAVRLLYSVVVDLHSFIPSGQDLLPSVKAPLTTYCIRGFVVRSPFSSCTPFDL